MKTIKENISKLLLNENVKKDMILGYLDEYEVKYNELVKSNTELLLQIANIDDKQPEIQEKTIIKKEINYLYIFIATSLLTFLIQIIKDI